MWVYLLFINYYLWKKCTFLLSMIKFLVLMIIWMNFVYLRQLICIPTLTEGGQSTAQVIYLIYTLFSLEKKSLFFLYVNKFLVLMIIQMNLVFIPWNIYLSLYKICVLYSHSVAELEGRKKLGFIQLLGTGMFIILFQPCSGVLNHQLPNGDFTAALCSKLGSMSFLFLFGSSLTCNCS